MIALPCVLKTQGLEVECIGKVKKKVIWVIETVRSAKKIVYDRAGLKGEGGGGGGRGNIASDRGKNERLLNMLRARQLRNKFLANRISQHSDIADIFRPITAPHPPTKTIPFSGAFRHINLKEKLFSQGIGGGGNELSKSNRGIASTFDIPRLPMQRLLQPRACRIQAPEQLFRRKSPLLLLAEARHCGKQKP